VVADRIAQWGSPVVGAGQRLEGWSAVWVPNLADAEWMTDVLSQHAGRLGIPDDVTAVHLLDARLTHPHRPESPLCTGWATYLLTVRDASPVQLYVKGFSGEGDSEQVWQQTGAARSGRRAWHLRELDLIVWRFPEDPQLTELPTLVDPRLAVGVLPAAVRDVLDLQPEDRLRISVVRYQPETSATLRLEVDRDGPATVFAKHYPDGRVAEVAARHQTLWRVADQVRGLRLAQPLAADPRRGVLWTRGVPGGPLLSAGVPAKLHQVTAAVGPLLSALHGSHVEVAQRLTVDDLLTEAHKKADKLARAHAPVAGHVHDLVTRATARRAQVPPERDRPLHGDFHLDQLVGSPDGLVLVDLDSMVQGAPEIDLAEFAVDLVLRSLPNNVTRDVIQRLLASYATSTGIELDKALLATCVDTEFVNRCYRHLRRNAPGWQAALEAELGRHADVVSHLLV
jgi:hypothetical protein